MVDALLSKSSEVILISVRLRSPAQRLVKCGLIYFNDVYRLWMSQKSI